MINIDKAKKIDGWMYEDELEWLAHRASESQLIVEVGPFLGRSTRALVDNINGVVLSIDIWDPGWYMKNEIGLMHEHSQDAMNTFFYNLADCILSRKSIPIRNTLSNVYSNIQYVYGPVDMIFIDGNHDYDSVLSDVSTAMDLVKSKGLICGHDYGLPEYPGVAKAVHELLGDVNLCHTIWYKRWSNY